MYTKTKWLEFTSATRLKEGNMRKIGMGTDRKISAEAELAALREENKTLRAEISALKEKEHGVSAGKPSGKS